MRRPVYNTDQDNRSYIRSTRREAKQLYNRFELRFRQLERTLGEISQEQRIVGPRGISYYAGGLLERGEYCYLLTDQIIGLLGQYQRLMAKEGRLEPPDWPAGVPYPATVQAVQRTSLRVGKMLSLSFECLYMTGAICLDQWAMFASCLGSVQLAGKSPFQELVQTLNGGRASNLQELWAECRDDIYWLQAHFRDYQGGGR